MKKEYNKPSLDVELIELDNQILTSGISKDDGNHSMNTRGDLIL